MKLSLGSLRAVSGALALSSSVLANASASRTR
ncbi:MAG: hypothetical protein ACI80N_004078 [Gammaproteobacteria bacterium]|jgi:hypothetical protein